MEILCIMCYVLCMISAGALILYKNQQNPLSALEAALLSQIATKICL